MTRPAQWDPTAPDFQDRLYEIYRNLRDEDPAHYSEAADSWVLTRYADVRWAATRPDLFSSENTSMSLGLLPQIQLMDPPRHDHLRALVSRGFTPRRVMDVEPRVRSIARELLDELAAGGRGNLLADYARKLPSQVMSDLIGVPKGRQDAFMEWTDSMVEIRPGETQQENVANASAKIYEEFGQLLEERRRERRDDLMSALLDADIEGERLSQDELLGFCFLLVFAGNDTTANLITNGSVMLARHPDQRRALAQDRALIPAAVEEMVRYESPSQALPRTATADFELHGVKIPAGGEVKLVWGSANHDERQFEDPDRFDIRRDPKRHLGFGHGIHVCMGANLARLEARVALEELLARIPEFELETDPRWLRSIWARAYAAVPIAFPAA